MSLSLVLKFQTPNISCIDREGPWHSSAGAYTHTHTHTHTQRHTHKLSNHVPSATSTDGAVQLRVRPTHFPPTCRGRPVTCRWLGAGVLCSVLAHPPPDRVVCPVPSSLLAHRSTACTRVHPASRPLASSFSSLQLPPSSLIYLITLFVFMSSLCPLILVRIPL